MVCAGPRQCAGVTSKAAGLAFERNQGVSWSRPSNVICNICETQTERGEFREANTRIRLAADVQSAPLFEIHERGKEHGKVCVCV
jgi:hypothetical protein